LGTLKGACTIVRVGMAREAESGSIPGAHSEDFMSQSPSVAEEGAFNFERVLVGILSDRYCWFSS
jgi:hypothetical protein